jgi:hypothetical protein
MAGSYVGHLDTKMISLRSACRKYLGLATPRYDYGPANLVGCPGCVTFRGQCALVALPACSGHPRFYVRNEGLPVGCTPNGPAKYFWVLGCFCLETFLRSTSSDSSARLLAAKQDIWMFLHSIRSRSIDFWLHSRPTPDTALQLRHHQRLLHSTDLSRSY